jgi:hypothetical protein
MTDWAQFSEADFDAARAPRKARQRESGQAPLFFVATPVTRPGRTAPPAAQLPGQGDLFGEDEAPDGGVTTRGVT